MTQIVIYRKHPCVKCDLTVKLAQQNHYEQVIVKEIFDDTGSMTKEAQTIVDEFQLKVAPLVQVFDEQQHLLTTWGDFNYTKIVHDWR